MKQLCAATHESGSGPEPNKRECPQSEDRADVACIGLDARF
jgi:hypothetical protein